MANERPSQHESEAEQQLRSERARVRAIVETAVDGIIVIDARGNVQSMNRAAEAIFGYEEAEVLGQNVSMLMPPPSRRARRLPQELPGDRRSSRYRYRPRG